MNTDQKLDALNDKLDSLIFSVAELQKLKCLDSKLDQAELKINDQQKEIDGLKEDNKILHQKLIDLELHSRRNNLRLLGVEDRPHETWDETKAKVMDIFYLAGCNFDARTLERAHRLGSFNHKQRYPRPIIVRFSHYMDREHAWGAMSKDSRTPLFVREDMPFDMEQARRRMLPVYHEARKTAANQARLKLDKLYIKGKEFSSNSLEKLPAPLQPKNIFTPSQKDQTAFFTSESPLSNFYPAQFTIGNTTYNCTEQYIQIQKALMFGDKNTAEEILKAPSGAKQKQISYSIKSFDRAVWQARASDAITPGIKAKFEQNNECKNFLLATGTTEIMEASPSDKFWGVGRGLRDPHLWDKAKRQGENEMGKVLMKVCEYLVNKSK